MGIGILLSHTVLKKNLENLRKLDYDTKYGVNKERLPFGGEYSGHMYFTDRWPGLDSALYNGLRMLEVLSKNDKPFSKLYETENVYYSIPDKKVK